MAEQKTIESPAFELIAKETGPATRAAINTLWLVLNESDHQRRVGVRTAQEESIRKVKADAPTASQNDYDTEGSPVLKFTGASNVNLTGLRNGIEGMWRELHVLGAGTITLKHESGSSDASNRFDTAADADVAVTTGKCAMFRYLNSRWRQKVLA